MKTIIPISIALLSIPLFARETTREPFPTNGMVEISFPSGTTSNEQSAIRTDFSRCLDVSRQFMTQICDSGNTNSICLGGLWIPDKYVIAEFPNNTSRTGNVFTISLDGDFVSSYRQQMTMLVSFSNEIARMDQFVATLATTNRMAMTDNELFGTLWLWKDARPGTHAIPAFLLPSQRTSALSYTYKLPPLTGYFQIPDGPGGQDMYLWALIPAIGVNGVSSQPAIYYSGRWWLSNWFWDKGQQLW